MLYCSLILFAVFSSVLAELDLEALAEVPSGINVTKYDPDAVFNGYLVMCPDYSQFGISQLDMSMFIHGPRVFHPNGAVLWAGDQWTRRCMNAQFQTWKGQRVLTFWYDDPEGRHGVILDENYEEIRRVYLSGGREADLHEFRITESGETALIIGGDRQPYDLTVVGGTPQDGVYDPIVQEVNIETGKLVWEWNPLYYLDLRHSYRPLDDHHGWEFAHTNAVLKDADDNYLISYRFYHSIIKVDGRTNEIIWMLGGMGSDFTFANGSSFVGQHDPQWVPGTNYTEMTIFDNDCDGVGNDGPFGTSRGIWVHLNYTTMRVTLLREYVPSVRARAEVEGGIQVLPNGNVLVAYGSMGRVAEYRHTGDGVNDNEIVFEALVNRVYRAFKYPKSFWHGKGLRDPDAPDVIEVDQDVSLVFHSRVSVSACGVVRAIFGLC